MRVTSPPLEFRLPSFKPWALFCALFLLLLLGAGLQPAHAFIGNKDICPALEKLEAHIQDNIRKKRIPGCAVAVVYKNQIVYMKAFGVKTMGTYDKIDVDTVFQLGSVSKPIAATLASMLENKGLLRLEDPVIRYLPNFALNSNQSPYGFKIKHILSHSSGLSRGGFNNLIESFASYEEIVDSLKRGRVRTTFGKQYDYHNAMFSLISEVTHAASGLSFSNALRTNLLQPLNMTRTSATLHGLLNTPNRASPHTYNNRYGLIPCDTYSKGYYTVAPAGGINSSVRDMANFLKAQLGGYPHILNAYTLSKLQTPQVHTKLTLQSCEGPPSLIKNARYALGWRVVDFDHHKLVYHGGMLRGFTNFIALIPQHQVGIVILHNSNANFTSQATVKFFETFLDVPKHHVNRIAKCKPRNLLKTKNTIKYSKNLKVQKNQKIQKAEKLLNLPQTKNKTKKISTTQKTRKNLAKSKNQVQVGADLRVRPTTLSKPKKQPAIQNSQKLQKPLKPLKLQAGPTLPRPVKELLRNSNQKVVKREVKPFKTQKSPAATPKK